MNVFLGTQERESLGLGDPAALTLLSQWHDLPIFVSLFSLLSSQPGHVLILALEEEKQERMEARGHRLKSLLQPLEDGISSGHCWCAAGWVRCMWGKSLHFPGTVLQQHPPTTLPLNFWMDLWMAVRGWLHLGWLYTMWLHPCFRKTTGSGIH